MQSVEDRLRPALVRPGAISSTAALELKALAAIRSTVGRFEPRARNPAWRQKQKPVESAIATGAIRRRPDDSAVALPEEQDELGRFWLGPTGPAFWRGVIELQRTRLADSQELLNSHSWSSFPPRARQAFSDARVSLAGPRIADALLLLSAIRRLEMLCERIAEHAAAAEVKAALLAFREQAPDAKDLRDVLEHLDAYAVRRGHRSATGAQEHWWPRVGADPDPFITIGKLHVDLNRAADAAVTLALATEAAVSRWVRTRP